MTTAWTLVRTAAICGALGLMLWATVRAVSSVPGVQFIMVIVLATPLSALLARKVAEALRTGVHITWRAAVDRRERPVFYWLAVTFEAVAAALILLVVGYSVFRLSGEMS